MIRTWLEEWFDTLLMLFFLFSSLVFSFYFWKEQYHFRCTEIVIKEFLNNCCMEGKVSIGDIDILLNQIRKIDSTYHVELIYTGTKLEPCYAQIPKEQLDSYYFQRNIRKEIVLVAQEFDVLEEKIEYNLQEETNASILAAGKGQYLPLPKEEIEFSLIAVRPEQKVYQGEALITLCLVNSADGNYYVEAEPVIATHSGMISMVVNIHGEKKYVNVSVISYPRELSCEKGHIFPNTKERIQKEELTGEKSSCPICAKLPQKIKSNQTTVVLTTGESLSKSSLFLEVTYLDGHVEKVFPSMQGWQDNYDSNFCGIQTITIQYGQLQETVVVISEGAVCMQCGNRCTGKMYEDYKLFPYCTNCMAESLLFTGEVYKEEVRMSLRELVSFLEEKKEMFLEEGERIMIGVKKEGDYVSMIEKTVMKNRKTTIQ